MEKEAEFVRQKLKYLSNLNEVDSRNYLGLWAIEEGWGGISKVNKLTGRAMDTIRKGIKEIKSGKNIKSETGRLRKKGGGRKNITEKNPRIIKQLGYSLQSNIKSKESGSSEERDSQFRYINETVKIFAKKNMPVISVDAKKKELVGNFKNNGKKWMKKGKAEIVNVYDFWFLAKGKAIPYGIYDINMNNGFVNVGIDHNTSEFAVESIRQ